jgi:hypothetical protein
VRNTQEVSTVCRLQYCVMLKQVVHLVSTSCQNVIRDRRYSLNAAVCIRYAPRNSHWLVEEFIITHLVIEFTAFMETKVALPFAQYLRLDPVLTLFHLVHVLVPNLFEVLLIYHPFNSVLFDQSLSSGFPKKKCIKGFVSAHSSRSKR